jgi:hypothetical protein
MQFYRRRQGRKITIEFDCSCCRTPDLTASQAMTKRVPIAQRGVFSSELANEAYASLQIFAWIGATPTCTIKARPSCNRASV